jgi:hypothetical protein
MTEVRSGVAVGATYPRAERWQCLAESEFFRTSWSACNDLTLVASIASHTVTTRPGTCESDSMTGSNIVADPVSTPLASLTLNKLTFVLLTI